MWEENKISALVSSSLDGRQFGHNKHGPQGCHLAFLRPNNWNLAFLKALWTVDFVFGLLAFFGFFHPFGLQIFRLAFWPILALALGLQFLCASMCRHIYGSSTTQCQCLVCAACSQQQAWAGLCGLIQLTALSDQFGTVLYIDLLTLRFLRCIHSLIFVVGHTATTWHAWKKLINYREIKT